VTGPAPRQQAGGRRRRRWRAFAAGCATLAIVLLAPLAAGTGHGAPPTASELRQLGAALGDGDPSSPVGSEVARQYLVAAAGREPLPADPAARAQVVGRARLLQLLTIGGISCLLYTAVLLARGRLQALLACAALAALPPVALEGALLRPEAPATLLAGLAVLLLQSFAQTVRRPAQGGWWRRPASLSGLGLCAALALGFAAAAVPSHGSTVLLPGLVVTLGAVMLLVRSVRVLRRGGVERLPYRAWNRRLLPWTAIALVAPAVVIGVLSLSVTGPIDALLGTPAHVTLLPEPLLLRAPLVGLLLLGAMAAVLRIGLRFGRGGHIGAELVLFVYCALELAAAIGAPPHVDRLPAAPALAVVLAEGGRVLLNGIAWLAVGRR
jgi:hypothetical protein